MEKVEGKNGISATIIADSISGAGIRLITYEVVAHRYIWAEMMTHRKFSRNAASTRAVPVKTVIEMVRAQPAIPTHWGMNNPGMQSKAELTGHALLAAEDTWRWLSEEVCKYVSILSDPISINGHKQWAGRPLEPFSMIKAVITATDYENFFALRRHTDAAPEIKELANVMYEAREKSTPVMLEPGQWHIPYVEYDPETNVYSVDGTMIDLDTARRVSASCCAQVSYRRLDTSIEKTEKIYSMLHLGDDSGEPAHASPTEHQGTPIGQHSTVGDPSTWTDGITHMDRSRQLWSGNFRGWIQFRQLIPNESVPG
jgi:hypothetical protein